MTHVWTVIGIDRTGSAEENSFTYGVYSTEEKALAAILYWIFEMGEHSESVTTEPTCCQYTDYVTAETIWRVERVELDAMF